MGDQNSLIGAQKVQAEAQAGITTLMKSNDIARQERDRRRQEKTNKHHEAIHQSQIEASSQRTTQIADKTSAINTARQERDIAQQKNDEKLNKLETDGKMRQDGLKADQQTRINEIKVQAAEQATEQKELLNEEMHSQRQGMAAQDNAHQQIMVDTKSAHNDQKLKQNTDLEAKKLEVTETKNLFKEEERDEKKQLELEKREIAREKLAAQKDQISMQIKYLEYYQTMCKTKDAESYYTDNIVPSVASANNCVTVVESVIGNARRIVTECKNKFDNDYKKVSGQICNFTTSACEQALTNLDIGRCSITSRAVESLKKLSHGLTKKEREDFIEALYDLEDAENKLRKLCEQMKNNVEYQSSFDELNELIKNIDNVALEMLRKRIRAIPAEESVAKAREKTAELMTELGDINENLHDLEKILPLTAPSTKPALKQ